MQVFRASIKLASADDFPHMPIAFAQLLVVADLNYLDLPQVNRPAKSDLFTSTLCQSTTLLPNDTAHHFRMPIALNTIQYNLSRSYFPYSTCSLNQLSLYLHLLSYFSCGFSDQLTISNIVWIPQSTIKLEKFKNSSIVDYYRRSIEIYIATIATQLRAFFCAEQYSRTINFLITDQLRRCCQSILRRDVTYLKTLLFGGQLRGGELRSASVRAGVPPPVS